MPASVDGAAGSGRGEGSTFAQRVIGLLYLPLTLLGGWSALYYAINFFLTVEQQADRLERDEQRMSGLVDRLSREHQARRAGAVLERDLPALGRFDGVGRCHELDNLSIVDGSVFVTSGGVNPTTTIQAIALYVADQMKRRLANLFD